MRPSETFALTWRDVNLEGGTCSISKSRSMGVMAATKTANSDRIIGLDENQVRILKLLPSRELGLEHVFVGKRGDSMSKKWAEHFWKAPLEKLNIRHRKFYATRHTYITEEVRTKGSDKMKQIADYVGTSTTMIDQNYCARRHRDSKSLNSDTGDVVSSEEYWLRGRDLNIVPLRPTSFINF